MSDYIPQEVWIDIFSRLSVRALLQIRSVCKLFNSLISSPSFIATHVNRTKQSRTLLLRHFSLEEHYLLLDDDQTFGKHKTELDFPFRTQPKGHFRIVGSCNGVLCLSYDGGSYAYSVILWNPSIKKYLRLPRPRVTRTTHGSYTFLLGFGFDPMSDDYKVVRVAYIKGRNGRDLIPPEVEVYTLSSGSWHSFSAGAPPYGIYGYTWSQAFVNGAVHWIGYDPCVANGNWSLIVSFDVGDEKFYEVTLPESLAKSGWDLSVSVFEGKLSVLHYGCHAKKRCCSVWVMEEYGVINSWTKVYTISFLEGLQKTIGFSKNGEVLLVTTRGKLVSYNPHTLQVKGLRMHGDVDSFYVDTYMESLVLLEAESTVLGADAITCYEGEEEEPRQDPQWPQFVKRFSERRC